MYILYIVNSSIPLKSPEKTLKSPKKAIISLKNLEKSTISSESSNLLKLMKQRLLKCRHETSKIQAKSLEISNSSLEKSVNFSSQNMKNSKISTKNEKNPENIVRNSMKINEYIKNSKNTKENLEKPRKKGSNIEVDADIGVDIDEVIVVDIENQRKPLKKQEITQNIENSIKVQISTQNPSKIMKNTEKPHFSQMTSNLININLNNLIKESNISPPSQKTLEEIEVDLLNFYSKYGEINENVSVMNFIESFFKLIETFGENQKNTPISRIFKLLKKIIEMPFERIIEQFTKMRGLYIEKIGKIKENDKILLEKKALEEKNRVLRAEMDKLKVFLKINPLDEHQSYEEIMIENEKLKQILQKQRKTLCSHRRKDEKFMKLLNGIRKKGINIEEIYKETIESLDNSLIDEPSIYYEETQERAQPYEEPFNVSTEKKARLTFSFTEKNQEKPDFKGKFRLNLEILNSPVLKKEEGFHEEFMKRMEEFSESWRVAALKEKRF